MLNITRMIILLILMGTPSQTFAHTFSAPEHGTPFFTTNQPGPLENVQESGSYQNPITALSSECQAPCSNEKADRGNTVSHHQKRTAGYAYDAWGNQGSIPETSGHSTQIKYNATTLRDITEYPGHTRKLNSKIEELNQTKVTNPHAYDALKKLSEAVAPKRGVDIIRDPIDPLKTRYRKAYVDGDPGLPDGWQVHHTIPQNYREMFADLGINIDDVQFLRGVDPKIHSKITTEWGRFDRKFGGSPTTGDVADFVKKIDEKYIDQLRFPGF